jgi:hypothetical protein
MITSAKALHYGDGWGNPLWGLPLQFSWQYDTGRLLNTVDKQVNTSSWWGGMNYFLSIIPFVSALEAKVVTVPEGSLLTIKTPNVSLFCASYQSCLKVAPLATSAWLQFFQRAAASPPPNVTEAVSLLWAAHVQSLHAGLPAMQPLLHLLPSKQEQAFGQDWASLVDFIAAMQFDVDYNHTNYLQGFILPPRLLASGDVAPFIRGFTPAQNRGVLLSSLFYQANALTRGKLFDMWKRVCCTAQGRADAYSAAINMLQNDKFADDVPSLIKVVADLLKSHPCPAASQ